jgi:IS1 family transposase
MAVIVDTPLRHIITILLFLLLLLHNIFIIIDLVMNQLGTSKRVSVIAALVEGNSVNSTCRMTGASKHTVLKLLEDLGCACAEYHNRVVRNVKAKHVEVDEIWQFCYAKDKNVPKDKRGVFGYGDVWTTTGIDAQSKLIISYLVARRDAKSAKMFMEDLSSRISGRIQMTTDGHKVYVNAVENAFGSEIDYAMLIKIYGAPLQEDSSTRYSPATCIDCKTAVLSGAPDPAKICTSYVERQNLTMRMSMRRFTRLTNGFSKKVENHGHAVALHFMHYNFVRIHKTLRVTPAMEAGLANHPWTIEELCNLIPEKIPSRKSAEKYMILKALGE